MFPYIIPPHLLYIERYSSVKNHSTDNYRTQYYRIVLMKMV